jgi:hypothetical protein
VWRPNRVDSLAGHTGASFAAEVFSFAAQAWRIVMTKLTDGIAHTLLLCLATLLLTGTCVTQDVLAGAVLDAESKAAIVEKVCTNLEKTYILAEDARLMANLLRENLRRGEYDGLSSLADFTERLTQDMRSIRHDLHLEVSPIEETESSDGESVDHHDPEYLRRRNYQVRKVEVLDGNVGYLKLDAFADGDDALSAGVAAMNFLAHTDALVIDLRENGGGDVALIQLMHNYLHNGLQQLSGIHIREIGADMQFWTQGFVPGPRLADVPVWVLVSERTFSAAEAFAYDMKHMGRGTIVGEVTRGGAHLVRDNEVPELRVNLRIPFARAVSPVTGGNWEGVGVQPDLKVPADEALAVAHAEAIRGILANENDPRWRVWLERALEEVAKPISD